MTVKKVSDVQKKAIAVIYSKKAKNVKQIAEQVGVSQRTIGRILVEEGLAEPVARIKGEAYAVMQVLKKHNVADAKDLDKILTSVADYAAAKMESDAKQGSGIHGNPQ